MFYYERKFKKKGFNLIIGIDEAGRGPLAGPVVAAAVAFNRRCRFKNRIDDSKKLTPFARELAFQEIIRKSIFGIGIVDEKIIDRINILQATCKAMEKALASLTLKLNPGGRTKPFVIVDGNVKLNIDLPYAAIVRGDSKSRSIASASILAKVTRDRIMQVYDRMFPGYGFIKHKGYATKLHKALLKKTGPCLIHRKTFKSV